MYTTHARFALTTLALALLDDAKASNVHNFLQATAFKKNGKFSSYKIDSLTRPSQLKMTPDSAQVLISNEITPFEIGQKMNHSIPSSTEEEAEIAEKGLDFSVKIERATKIITVLFTIMYDGPEESIMRVVLMEVFETPLQSNEKIITS